MGGNLDEKPKESIFLKIHKNKVQLVVPYLGQFILQLQWGHRAKMRFGYNPRGPIDTSSKRMNCMIFSGIPHSTIIKYVRQTHQICHIW